MQQEIVATRISYRMKSYQNKKSHSLYRPASFTIEKLRIAYAVTLGARAIISQECECAAVVELMMYLVIQVVAHSL